MVGNSSCEANFPQKLLLTNRQIANLRTTITNDSVTHADIKAIAGIKVFIPQTSKTQPAITCSKLTIETLEQGV